MPRTGKAPDGTPRASTWPWPQRVGRSPGAAGRVPLVCQRRVRLALPARGPLRRGRSASRTTPGPPRDVAWSVPYAGAQFGLVVPRDAAEAIRSLADLRGKRVGIVAGTVALSEKDHAVVRFKTREELLDGFAAAELDAAFLDADFAAWYLHEHPSSACGSSTEYVPRERWNMALAVRAKDAQLLVEINRALAQLAESGELRKIYADTACRSVPRSRRRPPAEAPPTPGARIRDRGELVVSMDPANLPYSGAKDDRPGFDVELARALAERLQRQAPDRLARHPARDRGRASCSSGSATWSSARPSTPTPSPTTRSWRARSSTRGPTTGPATCSSGARTARTSGRWRS